MKTYLDEKDEALSDPCLSDWAKNIIRTGDQRDVIDTVTELEYITKLFNEKWHNILIKEGIERCSLT